jgi:hypothetical protein
MRQMNRSRRLGRPDVHSGEDDLTMLDRGPEDIVVRLFDEAAL